MEELFLPRTDFENYKDFFENYKKLQNIVVEVKDYHDKEEALELLQKCREKYQKNAKGNE